MLSGGEEEKKEGTMDHVASGKALEDANAANVTSQVMSGMGSRSALSGDEPVNIGAAD